jgi:hypothetical protein
MIGFATAAGSTHRHRWASAVDSVAVDDSVALRHRRYRELVTGPKMAAVDRHLAANYLNPRPAPAIRRAAVTMLRQASRDVHAVVPDIHDLWSEQVFRRALTDDIAARERLHANRFLKPLAEFTEIERSFELTLAAMDLRSLISAAFTVFGLEPDPDAPQCTDPSTVPRALAWMSTHRAYLDQVMRAVHQNWLDARDLHALDARCRVGYARLTPAQRHELLANARADILAVLLFTDNQRPRKV